VPPTAPSFRTMRRLAAIDRAWLSPAVALREDRSPACKKRPHLKPVTRRSRELWSSPWQPLQGARPARTPRADPGRQECRLRHSDHVQTGSCARRGAGTVRLPASASPAPPAPSPPRRACGGRASAAGRPGHAPAGSPRRPRPPARSRPATPRHQRRHHRGETGQDPRSQPLMLLRTWSIDSACASTTTPASCARRSRTGLRAVRVIRCSSRPRPSTTAARTRSL
jgi:hypothetical protein